MTELAKELAVIENHECSSARDTIFSRSFLSIFLISLGISIFIFFLMSNGKSYYSKIFAKEGIIVSDSKLSLMITFGSISNSISRLVVGFLIMKVKLRLIFILMYMIVTVSAFSFIFLMKTYVMGVIYFMIISYTMGTLMTAVPSLSISVFGATYGTKIFSLFFLAFRISSFGQYLQVLR